MKAGGKGIAFIGSSFVVGLFGNPETVDMATLKKVAGELSTKEIRCMEKDKVTFKFKEKGKKPINVAGVCQFMISG